VVSGSRADYGLLYWVMRGIRDHPALELQTAVTGMHLSRRYGETWQAIEKDGFRIDARVDTQLEDDSVVAVTKSVGRGVIGFADAFASLDPDIVLILGDRFEILAAAQAALLGNRAIAHVAGGDVTEGAVDESMRHAMTKMAHLHFVTNEVAAARVRQLGEDPARVFNTGSPGLDNLKRTALMPRPQLESELGIRFRQRNLLVTFHPATLDTEPPAVQFSALLAALDAVAADTPATIVFTLPNADAGNQDIAALIAQYVAAHPNAYAFASLGQQRYLSLMAHADAVVGNSSSGLYEAPSLKVPTVNIGDRQKGRLAASSVVQCAPVAGDIAASIYRAFALDCSATVNPYGDGDSARRIVAQLAAVADPRALLRKRFFDVR
jgi:UDP-N-acetylglucosamine 2-epimerase (non-hydrolysing)/GDP/UDP-N,N'-diacetylbacillosamine 2-epimerase (hydrolysing)